MSEVTTWLYTQLGNAGYSVGNLVSPANENVIFENDSVLGFVVVFKDAKTLLAEWEHISNQMLREAQFALRQADRKAWNTYVIFLSEGPSDYAQTIQLEMLEANLIGTRKIARADIRSEDALRAALLPLLPVQSAPHLEAVDMRSEVKLRTTELPTSLVDAFIDGAPNATLTQLLESAQ